MSVLAAMPLIGPYRTLNLIEAAWWIALGLIVVGLAIAKRLPARWTLPLAVTLIAFGISDIVEVRTGAWYRPWWMLLWKASCVAVLAGYGFVWWRRSRRLGT